MTREPDLDLDLESYLPASSSSRYVQKSIETGKGKYLLLIACERVSEERDTRISKGLIELRQKRLRGIRYVR
jgi:hypothetical protein